MIAADDSHAGSLTVARRGTGGHLQTPGLAAPEHSDAERPAPHLGQDGRASAPMGRRTRARSRYARPGGTGDTFRPPAWRHLNHGLLRGQLAGRGQFVVPAYCLWVAGLAQGVVRSPEVGNWGTPPHPRLSGT